PYSSDASAVFSLRTRPPPSPPLFPYTTLFRSKPFAFAELLARLRSLLRRGQSDRDTMLRAGDLELDLVERKAARSGTVLPLRSRDRKSTRLNSSHVAISYAVFCLKKKKPTIKP